MKRSSVVAWTVVSVLVGSAAVASSDEKRDEILFLGLQKKGGANGGNKAVMKRIERMGEKVSEKDKSLSRDDRNCQKQECLQKLASTRQVNWVLGGEVRNSTARDYVIALWLYDAKQSRVLEETGDCESCDEEQLANAISTLAGRLLEQRGRREQTPAAQPPTPKPSEHTELSPNDAPPTVAGTISNRIDQPRGWGQLTRTRWVLVGALATIALTSLAAGIFFSARDVRGTCPYQPPHPDNRCEYSPMGQGVGYGLSIATLGVAVALTFP